MKKTVKIIIIATLMVLIFICLASISLVCYYDKRFGVNTWINNTYCTGKTIDEVNELLISNEDYNVIEITDDEGKVYAFPSSDIGVSFDYKNNLYQYFVKRNSFLGIKNLFSSSDYKLIPDITFDFEKLSNIYFDFNFVKNEVSKIDSVYIERDLEQGYVLKNNLSHRLDIENTLSYICEEIQAGNFAISLDDEKLFFDIPMSEDYKELACIMEKVDEFQKLNIKYDLGDEIRQLTANELASFLQYDKKKGFLFDDNGKLEINSTEIEAFIDNMYADYNTYKTDRKFFSISRNEWVSVPGVNYGTLIDNKAETKFLTELFLNNDINEIGEVLHIPEYKHTANVRGKNDIGDTYIEVDMTNQHLYYYEKAKLVFDTSVVTGNMRRGNDTPEGVNFVYQKQTNRILRGPNYASFVKYWMPVYKGIGIHDANWRDEFGGDIYMTNGSHGCVNVPSEKTAELFDMIEVGTPVIMYY